MSTSERPIAWTIAGSDPGGGAGIQADLKTMNALGVHGCTVLTAITVQNTLGVHRIEHVAEDLLREQMDGLADDLPPSAIKLGMLGSARNVEVAAEYLCGLTPFVVCDPVMTSSSGVPLLDLGARGVFRRVLLPRVDLLTPNLPEAQALVGHPVKAPEDVEAAAAELLQLGAKSVFIKGGHLEGEFCQDFWSDGQNSAWLTSPRQDVRHTHGTGCTLSAAIASCRALGYGPLDSIVIAKAYVNQGLRLGVDIGRGQGPLAHAGWPSNGRDLPWITHTAAQGRDRPLFPNCGEEPLGFCPVVDRAAWLERFFGRGVRTAQLRIKDLAGTALDEEVRQAVELARRFGARLFINDYWEPAIRHGAYGVHLGQEDMVGADLPAIAKAGLRLGLSAMSFVELARAAAANPSYVGIGSVFATPSKAIAYEPLGLAAFARLRRVTGVPVVAIGGITLDRAAEVFEAGADGIAVISDVLNAPDPDARAQQWLEFFRTARRRPPPE